MTHEAPRALAARIRGEMEALGLVFQRIEVARDALQSGVQAGLAADSAALNIHDFYVGLERVFEGIADNIDRSLPDGHNWHRDLLQQMTVPIPGVRPPVIPRQLHADLGRLLGFRHVVRNVYTYELDVDSVLQNVARVARVFQVLQDAVIAFCDWIEAVETGGEGAQE